MGKRKGESYLGGNTIITLSPGTVAAGLVEQAAEEKRQARTDQEHADTIRLKERIDADALNYQSESPTRRAHDTAEKHYRAQIHRIEGQLKLRPHPQIKRRLLLEEADWLKKLFAVVRDNRSIKRKIIQHMNIVVREMLRAESELANPKARPAFSRRGRLR